MNSEMQNSRSKSEICEARALKLIEELYANNRILMQEDEHYIIVRNSLKKTVVRHIQAAVIDCST